MSSRTTDIVRNVDRTNLELIDTLGSLTEADLMLPCADPSGGTVGEIVVHLSEGAPEVFAYLTGVVSGSYQPAPQMADGHQEQDHDHVHDHDHSHDHDHVHDHDHSHDHDHVHDHDHSHHHGAVPQSADPAAVLELVRVRRQIFTDFLAKLTDEQLESVAPVAAGITDGTRTLAEVIGDMVDHQAQHLAYMRAAIAGRPEAAIAGRPETADTP